MAALKTFQIPKWCCVPEDPDLRTPTISFVTNGAISKPIVLSTSAKAVYTIGRSETGVDISLRGELASRLHAAICLDGEGRKFLVDLRSANGTFLGGNRLEPDNPALWNPGVKASFGIGESAEVIELSQSRNGGGSASIDLEDRLGIPPAKKVRSTPVVDPLAALYGDLPEAKVHRVAPRVEERWRPDPIPPPADVKEVIFLDIDGVVRSVHGRTDFAKNVRTMLINGSRVALMGDSTNDNLAGIDFWPHAMRALKVIVSKTGAGVVLSSDWRKSEQLVEGVNNQLTEYGMPKLYGQTPDLDPTNVAHVVKAIHSNVREKRAKEIRKWLRQNQKVERWVAIDDMDLTATRKDELLHQQSGSLEPLPFLDLTSNFVKCNPAQGLTLEQANIAVSLLKGNEVSQEDFDRAYNCNGNSADNSQSMDPNFQGLGPSLLG